MSQKYQEDRVIGMDIMDAVDRAAMITAEIVGSISEDQFSLPTPCSEWTVRDVLNHLLLGDLLCLAWIRGETPPDRDVDHLGADPKASVLKGLADTRAELSAPGALARTVSTRMGQMSVAKLAERRIADLVAHLWDLAVATSHPTGYDPELVDFVETHYRARLGSKPREGAPIAEIQPVPPDATAADRLAGYLGRTVDTAP
jgi:uncharacterized protein (TIGR03086 family)